jgi:hypothetical protein
MNSHVVFGVVTPCSLLSDYLCFGGTHCFDFHSKRQRQQISPKFNNHYQIVGDITQKTKMKIITDTTTMRTDSHFVTRLHLLQV